LFVTEFFAVILVMKVSTYSISPIIIIVTFRKE
jgi:hypothetical protein